MVMLADEGPHVVVVSGSIGASAVGPFDTAADAAAWASRHLEGPDWSLHPFTRPEDWPGESLNETDDERDGENGPNGQPDLPFGG